MKKSALKEFIREEIIEILKEDIEDIEPTTADLTKKDSVTTTARKLADVTGEMKSVVKKWKEAEGAEKEALLNRLKELTKIKKELESLTTSIDRDDVEDNEM